MDVSFFKNCDLDPGLKSLILFQVWIVRGWKIFCNNFLKINVTYPPCYGEQILQIFISGHCSWLTYQSWHVLTVFPALPVSSWSRARLCLKSWTILVNGLGHREAKSAPSVTGLPFLSCRGAAFWTPTGALGDLFSRSRWTGRHWIWRLSGMQDGEVLQLTSVS